MRKKRSFLVTLVLFISAIAASSAWFILKKPSGLGQTQTTTGPSGGKGGPPIINVSTQIVSAESIDVTIDANGTVSSLNNVEIRPQVTSPIRQVHIKEGQFVTAGQVLFTLDDRADQANFEKLRAQVVKDQTALEDLQRQLKRNQELVEKNFVSQSVVDNLTAQVATQKAAILASEAAIQSGSVALSYNVIRSPIAGRAGSINVFAGSLAQPNSLLVSITQLDPIAITFNVPERYLPALIEGVKNTAKNNGLAVSTNYADSSKNLTGYLSFVDNAVDPQLGSIKAKATFSNKQGTLWPGQYISVRLPVTHYDNVPVIPMAAIITSPEAQVVYVIDAEQMAKPRKVKILGEVDDKAVVSGLQAGEKIVIDGKQNLKPGSKVKEARS